MKHFNTLALAAVLLFLADAPEARAQGRTCAEATAVSGGIVYTVDTIWAGGGFQYGCYPPASNDALWYVYRAPYNGTVEVTSCSEITTMNTRLSIFTGTCDDLECIAWNDDGNCPWVPTWLSSRVSFDVVKDELYFIQWDDEWLPTTDIHFQWIVNSCEVRVEGTVYRDLNLNSVRDNGEPLYPAILDRDGQGLYNYATQDPYLLCSTTGPHTITVMNPPLYYNVVPPVRSYTDNGVNYHTDMDFALQPIPGMYDGKVSIWGVSPWIGNNTTMNIAYENIGTEPLTGTLQLQLDPMLSFVSSPVTPTGTNGNTVTWDLGTLDVGEHGSIPITVFCSINAPWGYETNTTVLLLVNEADVDWLNNADAAKLSTVASVDPNDKHVYPVYITPEEVAGRLPLKYTVRFQNTGNAPAVNVVIRDTLDEALDITTLEMVGATHPYQVALGDREITWTFPNIMLPDSAADLPGSMGALHYRISPKDDLVLGDQVLNEAHIYFDYADAVTTNTVITTVSASTAMAEDGLDATPLLLHPNPATGTFHMRWLAASAGAARVVVHDAVGRIVHQQNVPALVHAQDLQVDVNALTPGRYSVHVIGEGVNVRSSLVVQP